MSGLMFAKPLNVIYFFHLWTISGKQLLTRKLTQLSSCVNHVFFV